MKDTITKIAIKFADTVADILTKDGNDNDAKIKVTVNDDVVFDNTDTDDNTADND